MKPKQNECNSCYGSDQNIEGDFCPECGQPSVAYKESVYQDMEENGELSPY